MGWGLDGLLGWVRVDDWGRGGFSPTCRGKKWRVWRAPTVRKAPTRLRKLLFFFFFHTTCYPAEHLSSIPSAHESFGVLAIHLPAYITTTQLPVTSSSGSDLACVCTSTLPLSGWMCGCLYVCYVGPPSSDDQLLHRRAAVDCLLLLCSAWSDMN